MSAIACYRQLSLLAGSPVGFQCGYYGTGPARLLPKDERAVFAISATIPSNTTIGAYDVSAMGTEPSVLRFSAPGESMPSHVIGTFADGSQVDMTHSIQMSYSSQNPQIATVDGQGIVTAVAPGSTRIVVSNGTYSYFVSTRVGQRQR